MGKMKELFEYGWAGENDVLRDAPLDISDKESIELWLREIGKIPHPVREAQRRYGNDNIDLLEEFLWMNKCLHIKLDYQATKRDENSS